MMNWFEIILGIWFATGFIIAIHEMRFDMDIGFAALLGAICLSCVGPFMIIRTITRREVRFPILFRRYE